MNLPRYKTVQVQAVDEQGVPYGPIVEMLEPQYGTTKETAAGVKWGLCDICTMSFPLNEMLKKNGKYYCRKNRCFEDTLPREQQK